MVILITTITVAFITAVIGPISVEWVKARWEKKINSNILEEAFDHNSVVDQQLDDIMHELKCTKIWIAQFHNGGHFYPTGKSIQKFSIFYEKITPGTNPTQTTFQNIPVSFFPKAFSKLYNEDELFVNLSSGAEDYGLKIMTNDQDSSQLCLFGLKNMNDEFIGVLAVEFNTPKPHFSTKEYIFIRQKIGAIGLLLSNYLTIKKP
jgi:hypothetical protein